MRLFHRTSIGPAAAQLLEARGRTFTGQLGTMTLRVSMEGGHYTRIEVETDQMGESRLDKNVKKFFVDVHRAADPSHRIEASS